MESAVLMEASLARRAVERKPSKDYGIKAHRQQLSPEQIDEVQLSC
jgi:hypothetical protein